MTVSEPGTPRAGQPKAGSEMEQVFFLLFSAIAVGAALTVVLARDPVHSALALMVCLLQVAALFILLRSPFLAAVQVFVYVGAVMVLFLFVIMMLDIRQVAIERFLPRGRIPTLLVLGLLALQLVSLLLGSRLVDEAPDRVAEATTVAELGTRLFTHYLLPFEVVSVILLVALVGAIVLVRREGAE